MLFANTDVCPTQIQFEFAKLIKGKCDPTVLPYTAYQL